MKTWEKTLAAYTFQALGRLSLYLMAILTSSIDSSEQYIDIVAERCVLIKKISIYSTRVETNPRYIFVRKSFIRHQTIQEREKLYGWFS